jgi:hypothetical protein
MNRQDLRIPQSLFFLLVFAVNLLVITGRGPDMEDASSVWKALSIMGYFFGLIFWAIFCVWFTLDLLTGRNRY